MVFGGSSVISIGLIGLGIVGSNLISIIHENGEFYKNQYGLDFVFNAIFEFDGALINENGLNLKEIMNSEDIRSLSSWTVGIKAEEYIPKLKAEIIIEATPVNSETGEPALKHILTALNSKKHVITPNKAPFYLKYHEIIKTAEKNGVSVKFEATVGSAIPLLSIKKTLAGNRITKIVAVLNGTSNYILSRMTNEGVDFELALKEAQELGISETDPTLDIEGYDAAGKLVILANHLMGMNKTIKDVKISGITHVNKQIIELASKDKKLVKHLGIAKKNGELEVSLKLIKDNSPLAVDGTLNAVYFETDLAGEIILTGRGAGGPEAAAGIISDIINICREYRL